MISKKPKVSIIINCFNGEAFLTKCLLSILNQTYENWEVIFWDNRSTENSKKIFLNLNQSKILVIYITPFYLNLIKNFMSMEFIYLIMGMNFGLKN